MKTLALVFALLVLALPAHAVDQVIPVTVEVASFSGFETDVFVTVPAGATAIVGWECRLWIADPTVTYAACNWFHNGGVEHKLGSRFTGPAAGGVANFFNSGAVMLPAGAGHRLTSAADLVWARFRCPGATAASSCVGGWATFHFLVP